MDQPLLCHIPAIPYSCDPEHYDYSAHHMVCRSLFSTLVSLYEKGSVKGVVAESWTNSNDYREWKFKLREDVKFHNGEKITAQHIIDSWKRLALIQKKTKNKMASLLENIVGMDKVNTLENSVDGLKIDGNYLTILLKNTDKEFLKTVSFGLYAIIHPNQYDKQGQWIQKDLISSGPYYLSSWDTDNVIIKKRTDWISNLGHTNSFKTIKFTWNDQEKDKASLVISTSIDDSVPTLSFYGPVPSGIYYTRLFNWKKTDSFFYSIENRMAFEESLKEEYIKNGLSYPKTFFPVLTKPEIHPTNDYKKLPGKYKIKLALWGGKVSQIADRYATMIENAAKRIGVEVERITDISAKGFIHDLQANEGLNSNYDMALISSGVLVESPIENIRFMFLTKDGVNMPDITGEIRAELKKETPSLTRIEELMAEQKVVFPLGHLANGIWATEDIDFSHYNILLPPVDFQWIGQK